MINHRITKQNQTEIDNYQIDIDFDNFKTD